MLEAGIDHVIMHLSFTPYSTPAITAIQELAAAHGLVIRNPNPMTPTCPIALKTDNADRRAHLRRWLPGR
jgi:hypothetical protein